MADEHHGFGFCDEEIFEPLDRLDVEVVGGFVKQEYVGAGEENLGEFDAHAPPA